MNVNPLAKPINKLIEKIRTDESNESGISMGSNGSSLGPNNTTQSPLAKMETKDRVQVANSICSE